MARGTGQFSPEQNGQVWPAIPDTGSVSIMQTLEMLKITFLGENGEQTSLHFRRYHFNLSEERYDDFFTCNDSNREPRLRFLADQEGINMSSYLYVGARGTLVFLLKAIDGSLIVQMRTESVGAGLFLIGSHVSFDSVWWRYLPLDNASDLIGQNRQNLHTN